MNRTRLGINNMRLGGPVRIHKKRERDSKPPESDAQKIHRLEAENADLRKACEEARNFLRGIGYGPLGFVTNFDGAACERIITLLDIALEEGNDD